MSREKVEEKKTPKSSSTGEVTSGCESGWKVQLKRELKGMNFSQGVERLSLEGKDHYTPSAILHKKEVVHRQPIGEPLPAGDETRSYSVDEYVTMWEKQQGRAMTDEEKDTLARGCIGVTALNLGQGDINPPLELSFSTFNQAKIVADAINNILKAKPGLSNLGKVVAGNLVLKKVNNVLDSFPVDPDPTLWKAIIFSKRFWSGGNDYEPDSETGQVDMSDYDYEAKPGFVNFDYGWYEEETDTWWHANHCEPGMKVYQSTLEHYSRPLLDFDQQVFCVAFARKL